MIYWGGQLSQWSDFEKFSGGGWSDNQKFFLFAKQFDEVFDDDLLKGKSWKGQVALR